jgi:UDP-N-acetylglucosamine diphosphorylase/glucosamine-1-phosphate N-acetyltransferase
MTRNAEQIARDWVGTARRTPASVSRERARATAGPRVEISDTPLGPVATGGPVHIGPSAELPWEIVGGDPKLVRVDPRNIAVEPFVVFDVSAGPIWLEQGVTIRAFTRLAGPAWVGRSTTLLGGSISSVSIGPHCKVRGDVEASVILGYSNKAHDGFLGHACLGRWVNLGALTTNSDLKNNYGTVRIWTPDGATDTGEKKIGCLLGDHVKTAIGTMLGTGTVVGAGANVFGPGRPPTLVAPFTWGDADHAWDIERFLATAGIAMERRGVALTPGVQDVLRRAWRARAIPGAPSP